MKTFKYVTGLPKLRLLSTEEINGSRYYISPKGNKLPSVTTVLGYFKKQQLQEWRQRVGYDEANRISNRAATRGTKFHNMVEKYLRNNHKNLFENVMPDMRQSFMDARKTIDMIDNIQYIEATLFSETLGLAGRTDVIGDFAGTPSIIDFKTSLREKKEEHIKSYFEQATAYSEMYYEMIGKSINQIVIIISVDGMAEPQVFIKDRADYLDSLLKKILIYQKENAHVS